MAEENKLLNDVKDYLDITWKDDATDRKLTGIIARGEKYLDNLAGTELDYVSEGKPKELLLDYCRYVRSNALEDFQKNFLSELISLQVSEEVKRIGKEDSDV